MAKTCRTCDFENLWRYCTQRHKVVGAMESCEDHKPRETPLLVDALGEALQAMLTLPYRPLRSSSRQADRIDMIEVNAKAAVSRYKEEVGDA